MKFTDPGKRPKIPCSLSCYSHWVVIHDDDGDNDDDNDDDDDDATMMMMMILSIFAGDKNFITEWETGCD